MTKKRVLSILLVLTMLFGLFATPTFAVGNDPSGSGTSFSDVPTTHWAHEAIAWMSAQGILKGVGDGSFHPGDAVTREQFARIMVAALQLNVSEKYPQSFSDVPPSAWSYKYVESAKFYLTGFDVPGRELDIFKPAESAVREDMAVALVRALGLQDETPDLSVLAQFADLSDTSGGISKNLLPDAAIAVKHGILTGVSRNGALYFDAQRTLTRAEASVLVYRSLAIAGEKVTYDELPKITYPAVNDDCDDDDCDDDDDDVVVTPVNTALPAATIKATVLTDGVKLTWSGIADSRFSGYKVVISKSNNNPKYPEDGYFKFITDPSDTSVLIANAMGYKGTSDFGGKLVSGQTYYARITTLFSNGKTHGNVITIKLP